MVLQLIKSKYVNANELPTSPLDDFDGGVECDENEFLTSLLIRSHSVNPKFQRNCKNIFKNENIIGVNSNQCKYLKQNVKSRDMCLIEARNKHNSNNKLWPKTSNILDLLWCWVVCDNVESLNTVMNRFKNLINNGNGDSIKRILTITNGFKNVSSSMEIDSFNYTDVKMNVLIEYLDIQIIGGMQIVKTKQNKTHNAQSEQGRVGNVFVSFFCWIFCCF